MNDERIVTGLGPRTRRTVLAGAGAVGATVVLVGCGTDTTSDISAQPPAGNEPAGGASASAGSTGGGGAIAQTGDVPVGGGAIIESERVVITQPTAGEYKCFTAICTHQQCTVTSVDGGTINCACHNSKFSIEDGSVTSGPAPSPLEEKDIAVEGESITLA